MPWSPERGDLIWLDFHPQTGHEQSGRRPALVISPQDYNRRIGLALVCPVTSRIKGYPFEVVIPQGYRTNGAVLADQLRSLDTSSRQAVFIEKAPPELVARVWSKLKTLLPGQ